MASPCPNLLAPVGGINAAKYYEILEITPEVLENGLEVLEIGHEILFWYYDSNDRSRNSPDGHGIQPAIRAV